MLNKILKALGMAVLFTIVLLITLSLNIVAESRATETGKIEKLAQIDDVYSNQLRMSSITKSKVLYNKISSTTSKLANQESQESTNVNIEDCIVIGDSNTVRMANYDTELSNAFHISAITGVGVGGWKEYTRSGNTTSNETILADLENLPDNAFEHVVIMLGTNDFRKEQDEFTEQYTEILDYIKLRNSNAIVNLVTIPPVNDSASPSIDDADADKISEYIKNIYDNYDGLELNLIDLNNNLSSSDMSKASGDGYHFSRNGAVKAAIYIASNLN